MEGGRAAEERQGKARGGREAGKGKGRLGKEGEEGGRWGRPGGGKGR